MIEEQAKRRVVGEIEWCIGKLKTHAEMARGRDVDEASLRLLPSVAQCDTLAERLGAALVELQGEAETQSEHVRSGDLLAAVRYEIRLAEKQIELLTLRIAE